MVNNNRQSSNPDRPPQRRLDIPELIKFILLFLLLLLLGGEIASGEFRTLSPEEPNQLLPWLILSLKLLLIILLVFLIWVQRNLIAQLIAPVGCTEEEPDPVAGELFVTVKGTASGIVFGSYQLTIQKDGDPPIPGIISYPGGGASGSVPVINGVLGQINTTSLSDGAYNITLTVYPIGWGSPQTAAISFNLLKAVVYINRVGNVPAISSIPTPGNANPFDPAAELCSDVAPFTPKAIGGSITMTGAAYIYECTNRKILNYEIRYAQISAPGGEPAQPLKDTVIPAIWPIANRVSPLPLEYTIPGEYNPWTRVGLAPTNLINSWKTMTIGSSTFYKLNPGNWDSGSAGSGRFSLLLSAEDTAGHRYHDIQHIWLDNKDIIVKIVKFQVKNPDTNLWEDISVCTDLLLSFGTIRIVGIAWDPIIDLAFPSATPNDNFDYYRLDFWKQFSPVSSPLTGNISSRVPTATASTPTDADAGELGLWDLTTLDADASPPSLVDPANQISRGASCTYTLQLYATDNTLVSEGTTHYHYYSVPVKIINDL